MPQYWCRAWKLPLLLSLCLVLLGLPSYGAGKRGSDGSEKISPVLKQEVDFLLQNPHFDYPIPLIIQVQSDFFERQRSIGRAGGHRTDNMLSGVHAYTANLTATQIKHLLRSPLVSYVTLDAVLRPTGKPDKGGGGKPDKGGGGKTR